MTGSTRRTITLPPQPEGRGPNGRPFCRWCGEEVSKGRRTFCSVQCVDEYRVRADPGYARALAYRRDQGVCALCGVDTVAIEQQLRDLRRCQKPDGTPYRWGETSPYDEFHTGLVRKGFDTSRSLWDLDHIIPVVEGGGECGLENLRTLCQPCHKQVTADLAARRAATRRPGRKPRRSRGRTVVQLGMEFGADE